MDYVIIDTPPAGIIGDAQIFAHCADAVMIVSKQNYMLAEDINEVMDAFRDKEGKVLGVVLNGVRSFSAWWTVRWDIIRVNTANTDVTAIMEEVKECRVYGRL